MFKQIYDGKLVGKYLPHLPDPELPPQCRTQEPVLVQELVPVLVLAEMIVSVRCIIAGL